MRRLILPLLLALGACAQDPGVRNSEAAQPAPQGATRPVPPGLALGALLGPGGAQSGRLAGAGIGAVAGGAVPPMPPAGRIAAGASLHAPSPGRQLTITFRGDETEPSSAQAAEITAFARQVQGYALTVVARSGTDAGAARRAEAVVGLLRPGFPDLAVQLGSTVPAREVIVIAVRRRPDSH